MVAIAGINAALRGCDIAVKRLRRESPCWPEKLYGLDKTLTNEPDVSSRSFALAHASG